jgi:serine/threonine protein kinase
MTEKATLPKEMNAVFGAKLRSRFEIKRFIGKGGFGEVWEGVDIKSGTPVAIKVEKESSMPSSLLHIEVQVLKVVGNISASRPVCGFPALRYFGQDGSNVVLVLSLLGPSLEHLLHVFGHMSSKTVAMLGQQMLSRLELLHTLGFIHRDLKPDNFLMGTGKLSHHVYLIDFGLSSRYVASSGALKEMKTDRKFLGTTRFASLNTHLGYSQSRRDDIEQLSLVLIYLYRGHLPWSRTNYATQQEKEVQVGLWKARTSTAVIAAKCPIQLQSLLDYARSLAFTDPVDYGRCRRMLEDIIETNRNTHDFMYDWRVLSKNQPETSELKSEYPTENKSVGVGQNSSKMGGSATSYEAILPTV